jgi:hypothetical protein
VSLGGHGGFKETSHIDIVWDGRKEQLSIQENRKVVVPNGRVETQQRTRRAAFLGYHLREIERLLLLLVVRRKVFGGMAIAVIRSTIDGPVLQDT